MAVEDTIFGEVIGFMNKLGVYDIILPFLLVFTIVFAILEKTKVLGVEEVDNKKYTKKNLNAIVAFVISFLVVASTTLVRVINEAVANIVLLMLVVISFLMLVGVFFGSKEVTLENFPGWTKFFMVVVFIGIVVIFLQALGWLEDIVGLFIYYYDVAWVAALILIILILAFMWFITKERKEVKETKSSEKE